jgi:hypothetical protein
MFNYVEDLDGFLQATVLVLFRYYQIDVDVGVDEVAVGGAPHRALDPHKTMLLRPLEHRFRVEIFRMAGIFYVRPDPTNIFAPSEAPLPQTHAAHVQPVGAAAPQKYETSLRCDLAHV